jgi:uncharacterized protein YpmS
VYRVRGEVVGQNKTSGGVLLTAVSKTAASRVELATIFTPQAATNGAMMLPVHWYITVT